MWVKKMPEIAKEYGAALFLVASENKNQIAYYEALQTIESAFLENPIYLDMLSSPSISLIDRISAIDAAFGKTLPEEVLSYLKLLIEKGRIGIFLESVQEYKALLDASLRTFKAQVTSAVELTEEEKVKVCELSAQAKADFVK